MAEHIKVTTLVKIYKKIALKCTAKVTFVCFVGDFYVLNGRWDCAIIRVALFRRDFLPEKSQNIPLIYNSARAAILNKKQKEKTK